jgi:hypothetical protein
MNLMSFFTTSPRHSLYSNPNASVVSSPSYLVSLRPIANRTCVHPVRSIMFYFTSAHRYGC